MEMLLGSVLAAGRHNRGYDTAGVLRFVAVRRYGGRRPASCVKGKNTAQAIARQSVGGPGYDHPMYHRT
jgi:hypothetical protein